MHHAEKEVEPSKQGEHVVNESLHQPSQSEFLKSTEIAETIVEPSVGAVLALGRPLEEEKILITAPTIEAPFLGKVLEASTKLDHNLGEPKIKNDLNDAFVLTQLPQLPETPKLSQALPETEQRDHPVENTAKSVEDTTTTTIDAPPSNDAIDEGSAPSVFKEEQQETLAQNSKEESKEEGKEESAEFFEPQNVDNFDHVESQKETQKPPQLASASKVNISSGFLISHQRSIHAHGASVLSVSHIIKPHSFGNLSHSSLLPSYPVVYKLGSATNKPHVQEEKKATNQDKRQDEIGEEGVAQKSCWMSKGAIHKFLKN